MDVVVSRFLLGTVLHSMRWFGLVHGFPSASIYDAVHLEILRWIDLADSLG